MDIIVNAAVVGSYEGLFLFTQGPWLGGIEYVGASDLNPSELPEPSSLEIRPIEQLAETSQAFAPAWFTQRARRLKGLVRLSSAWADGRVVTHRSETDWVHYWSDGNQFHAAASVANLAEVIDLFQRFVTGSIDT